MSPKDWDPTKPDLKHATGTGKKSGGYKGWLIALAILLAFVLVAILSTGR